MAKVAFAVTGITDTNTYAVPAGKYIVYNAIRQVGSDAIVIRYNGQNFATHNGDDDALRGLVAVAGTILSSNGASNAFSICGFLYDN